jgi:hypothetical protein
VDDIQTWGYDQKPFNLTCSHCLKDSFKEKWDYVNGMPIPNVIAHFKFRYKLVEGGAAVCCSRWCLWRHGKSKGIHRLLNYIGHKSNAYKA